MTPEQKWIWRTVIRVVLLGGALAGVIWTIIALQKPNALSSAMTPILGAGPASAPVSPAKPPLTNSGGNQ